MFVILTFGFYVISQNGGNSTGDLAVQPAIVSNTTNTKKQTSNIPVVNSITSTLSGLFSESNDDGLPSNFKPTVKTTTPKTVSSVPKPVSSPASVAVDPKKIGMYTDGTYTGDTVDAYYGNVQVQVVVSGGKITNVVALDYPQTARNSIRINSRAIPLLQQEAITAQSSNINAVSGASATSPAFISSLTSAVNQAKA